MNHAGGQHEYACIAGGENHDGCDERGNAVNPIVDEADHYGWMDYRSISGWKFPAWPLLQPSTRAKMTIGTLHVKVVEARGLISRDFAGRSDPFAELELTGRYLSHGQEWSEPLRVREKTRVIKFSLNPVWNEEFSLPVRRAGAVLRIRLWDWNASIPDDPLGHIEVKMGGDLLAQKIVDRWYALRAPLDLATKTRTGSHPTDTLQVRIRWRSSTRAKHRGASGVLRRGAPAAALRVQRAGGDVQLYLAGRAPEKAPQGVFS
ncbi:unnamed protein product [Ectocarpus sp. 8 AP-2014]